MDIFWRIVMPSFWPDWFSYWVDAGQRWVLMMDALRKRANLMLDHYARGMPPVLKFDYEVILDAREFDPPANYALVRIIPPDDVEIDADKPPVVIFDPRAGHGPGIGGFKEDSEVGMALREGFETYFVIFFPDPCEGQTIEDVERAEIRFLEDVHRRHPDAGRPVVYGNCQAGWAVAMLGADHPEVCGPIILNGAPMSYWAGEAGASPMRASGGLLGGDWTARLISDLGAGKFDGAWLVHNFEQLNPSRTYFKKIYDLFRDIDTAEGRFLEFEQWWTGFYQLTEAEIIWIVQNLFIGNCLEQGKLKLSENHKIDLRNARDPIIVFASGGDNITPPAQALNWIAEVYPTTEELKKHGQRIIYLLNPHAGHLGIFVSATVAKKEHRAMIENIHKFPELDPGLYQMIIVRETGETDPKKEQFVVEFEERRVEDVDFPIDKEAFRKVDTVSRTLDGMYCRFVRPWVRPFVNEAVAEAIKWMHPDRISRIPYSDRLNPWMLPFGAVAALVQSHRRQAAGDNRYIQAERQAAENTVALMDAWRDLRDDWYETLFRVFFK
jgi:pimeloyl-ACP methyl ester carboxylesterase